MNGKVARRQILRLLPAERGNKVAVRALADLLEVCLVVTNRHVLEVSYVVRYLYVTASIGVAERHLVQALAFTAAEEHFLTRLLLLPQAVTMQARQVLLQLGRASMALVPGVERRR